MVVQLLKSSVDFQQSCVSLVSAGCPSLGSSCASSSGFSCSHSVFTLSAFQCVVGHVLSALPSVQLWPCSSLMPMSVNTADTQPHLHNPREHVMLNDDCSNSGRLFLTGSKQWRFHSPSV